MPGFTTTPLHEASEAGDLPLCLKLVEEGADITALDRFSWSPLIRAVQGDHVEAARYLLTQGAPIDYTYQHEETPEARKRKLEEWAAMDDQLGLRESMREQFKDLPPHLVEEMTSEKARREMHESMVDLHFAPSGEHAIQHATSMPMIELLVVGFGADINHVAPDGYWPLSSFAESGDLPAVRWLLDHGADPNNTSTGETAIFKAVRGNHLEMTRLLIERGAKVNVQDVDGWTPLFACQSVEAVKLLIDHGADPTITDQADFPCWEWCKDDDTRDFLIASAKECGMRK
jgi:hypothetical protein